MADRRKLVLRKETLSELVTDELRAVVGGATGLTVCACPDTFATCVTCADTKTIATCQCPALTGPTCICPTDDVCH